MNERSLGIMIDDAFLGIAQHLLECTKRLDSLEKYKTDVLDKYFVSSVIEAPEEFPITAHDLMNAFVNASKKIHLQINFLQAQLVIEELKKIKNVTPSMGPASKG